MAMKKIVMLSLVLTSGTAVAFEGTPHPEWTGKNISSAYLAHTGKPTIYVFAQPDCAGCSLQLASIASLQKGNPDLQVVVVTEQNSSAMKEYLNGFSLSSNVFSDPEGQAISALKITTIPATIYTDPSGKVKGFYEGSLNSAETKKLIDALVAGKSLPLITVPGSVGSPAIALPGVNWKSNKNNLIIFHSVSCHFCTEELPHLMKYAAENPQVAIWVVSGDDLGSLERQFEGKTSNINFVQDLFDSNLSGRISSQYKIQGTPTQILVNQDGIITWRGSGFNEKTLNIFTSGKLPIK